MSGAPVEEDVDPDHPESNQGSNQGWPSSSSVHSGGAMAHHEEPEAMAEGSVAGASPPLLPAHDLPHEAAGLQEDHQIEDEQELLLDQMIPMRGNDASSSQVSGNVCLSHFSKLHSLFQEMSCSAGCLFLSFEEEMYRSRFFRAFSSKPPTLHLPPARGGRGWGQARQLARRQWAQQPATTCGVCIVQLGWQRLHHFLNLVHRGRRTGGLWRACSVGRRCGFPHARKRQCGWGPRSLRRQPA